MAPMLLNEMQKQQHTIEGQNRLIAELAARLEQIEAMRGSAAASEGELR